MRSKPSASYKEAYAAAQEISKALKATDSRFSRCVSLKIDDGTQLFWMNSFVVDYEESYLMIFTEHHGFYVYHYSDIVEYTIRSPYG